MSEDDRTPTLKNGPHPPCDKRCGCGCHHDDPASYRPVTGNCPMGCGQTLGLPVWPRTEDASEVRCYSVTCPSPRAAALLLRETETEHVVHLGVRDFHMQHPLRERAEGSLWGCPVHQLIAEAGVAVTEPGAYRVTQITEDGIPASGLLWEKIGDHEVAG